MSWADYGYPIMRTPEIDECLHLMRHLYNDLRQPTGGPLHVQLDDGNLYNDNFTPEYLAGIYDYLYESSRWHSYTPDQAEAIKSCCEQIVVLMRGMDEVERFCCYAWHWGDAQKVISELEPWDDWQTARNARP